MATIAHETPSGRSDVLSAWLQTGLAVAISDGLFASATGMFIAPYATPLRVFRGVASVLLGKEALNGGLTTGLIGIGLHFCTAMFWSAVFLLALRSSSMLRNAIRQWPGALLVASVYGPSIWLFMSLLFIPAMLHRPPTIGAKWWVQLVGHIPFVVMPMILVNRKRGAHVP